MKSGDDIIARKVSIDRILYVNIGYNVQNTCMLW